MSYYNFYVSTKINFCFYNAGHFAGIRCLQAFALEQFIGHPPICNKRLILTCPSCPKANLNSSVKEGKEINML